MGKLDGKIALITGGTTGIGFSTAHLFLKEGARLIVTGRNAKNVEEAQKALGTNALAITADASDLSSTDALMKEVSQKFGRIDVLFANAGIAQFAPAEQVDENFFDRHFDLNVKGLYFKSPSGCYPTAPLCSSPLPSLRRRASPEHPSIAPPKPRCVLLVGRSQLSSPRAASA